MTTYRTMDLVRHTQHAPVKQRRRRHLLKAGDARLGRTALAPFLLTLLCGGALAACGSGEVPAEEAPALPVAFDTARIRIASGTDTVPLLVELAATPEQRAFGLMVRPSLPPDAGMLFLYDSIQPETSGFWMFRTRIPLQIAFLDSAGTIRAIRSMAPCDSTFARSCPTYPAGVPYRAALEVNEGYFARKGIGVGDRVLIGAEAGTTDARENR